ncbi:MAG TPA: DUF1003 domain-containing protein [Chloroflexota bacterium]|nr:DUF1003 domain-containing protein [Chloroflexota bacterium]
MNAFGRIGRGRVARNVNEIHEATTTFGERVADSVARFGGSWTFIFIFLAVMLLWVGINSLELLLRPFDPFPFIFLNLVLSCLAALQAPVIMMSQNRQTTRDRIAAEHDYEVNLKAELEIEELHQKMDVMREDQWAELARMQQHQIALLEELLTVLGPLAPADKDRLTRADDVGQDGRGQGRSASTSLSS